MNELQKIRAELLDKLNYDVTKAKDCFNFIIGEEIINETHDNLRQQALNDGVYICYNDGHYELFDGEKSKDNVRGIGLVVGEHSMCISLDEQKSCSLINTKDKSEECIYISDWDEARTDYDGEVNTLHIKSIGTDIKLKDGEYIPSLGELYLICLYKYEINKALSHVGGIALDDIRYWSSTELSSNLAWYLDLSAGAQSYASKDSIQSRVRLVSSFI